MTDLNDQTNPPNFAPVKAERTFLFIDETGDPGHPSHRDASRFYQLNIVVTSRSGIQEITKHFSRFRYFRDSGKELERYMQKDMEKLRELFDITAHHSSVLYYSFYLDKSAYIGPYLQRIGVGKHDYNPFKFRNFIVRKALEKVCRDITPALLALTQEPEIELVFDRYLASESDEQNLKEYLRGNYKLPNFLHIVQVDSEYSDLAQVSDLLGKFVKKTVFDEKHGSVEFAHVYCLENPDLLRKRKGPGHS